MAKETMLVSTRPNVDDILAVAIKVFSQKGYVATNMQDIATEMNTTRTPLYYHFKNKKVLYQECVQRYLSMKRETYTTIDTKDAPFIDILREHLYCMLQYVDKINESNLMGAITKEDFPVLYDLTTETTKYIRGLKRRMIERAIAKGELKANLDTDQLINFIFVQSYGLMRIAYEPVYCMGHKPLHQQVDTILALLWNSGIFTESARIPEMAATPFLFPETK